MTCVTCAPRVTKPLLLQTSERLASERAQMEHDNGLLNGKLHNAESEVSKLRHLLTQAERDLETREGVVVQTVSEIDRDKVCLERFIISA